MASLKTFGATFLFSLGISLTGPDILIAEASAQDESVSIKVPISAKNLPPRQRALMSRFITDHINFIKEGERIMQDTLPNFKFVMTEKSFDKRLNATETYRARSMPSGSIATLHDFHTGEPLESCKTPCNLSVAPTQSYHISHYKMGHLPFIRINTPEDRTFETIPRNLGADMLEAFLIGMQCQTEFRAQKNKADQDAKPCYRVPPLTPPDTYESGFCIAVFDVNQNGFTENIKAKDCTHPNFKRQSEAVVRSWTYTPKIERGQAVTQRGVETKLTYRIVDLSGELLAGPEGAMPKPGEENPLLNYKD